MQLPRLDGILETALYVDDPARAAEFYREVLGFEVIDSGDRLIAMTIADRQVLLLFRKRASANLLVSAHDGEGRLHLAFAIGADGLQDWENWLTQNKIAIEQKRQWDRGGQSLYFRDPDGHLLELATPGAWSFY